jgi:predicted nucleotidyltransferase
LVAPGGEVEMTTPLLMSSLRARREQLVAIAARHGGSNLRVFGSVARGEAGVASDLDLLVDLEPGRTVVDLGALLVELEVELGQRIDLMLETELRPALLARVLVDATPL